MSMQIFAFFLENNQRSNYYEFVRSFRGGLITLNLKLAVHHASSCFHIIWSLSCTSVNQDHACTYVRWRGPEWVHIHGQGGTWEMGVEQRLKKLMPWSILWLMMIDGSRTETRWWWTRDLVILPCPQVQQTLPRDRTLGWG
jgi:hypothetical protein